jgi:hypothetical protein
MPVRIFCAVLFVLLALYLGSGLLAGDIKYGQCAGRMSKNCNTIHLDTPLELTVGALHLGTLLFALGSLALKPEFFMRRRVLLGTLAVFLLAHFALIILTLA